MAMMNVILTEDVPKLGRKHEAVKVRPGFAMNFLFSQNKAVPSTPARLKKAEKMLAEVLIQKERIVEKAEDIKKQLEEMGVIKFAVKTTDKDTLYGSITEREIAHEIENMINVRLEKKHIRMPEHIKKVGAHTVVVRLADGVEVEVGVEVTALKE